MPELTVERLRELFHYDPETGVFTRRQGSARWRAGEVAGSTDRHGYFVHNIRGKLHRAHRLAWLYVHGEWPSGDIDHINGDRKDNRIANLRNVSRSVNLQNQRVARSASSTGLLGAHRDKTTPTGEARYRMRIDVNGKTLGRYGFKTPEEAHEAYLDAKRKLHEGCSI